MLDYGVRQFGNAINRQEDPLERVDKALRNCAQIRVKLGWTMPPLLST